MENLAPIAVVSSLEEIRKVYSIPPPPPPPHSKEDVLGEGSYGVVTSEGPLALKRFRPDEDNEGLDLSTIKEIAIYQYLTKHAPHIIPRTAAVIIGDSQPDGAILMEKYPFTLGNVPIDLIADKFSLIARSLIEKLCAWSKMGLAHRDLKPHNILINPDSNDLRVIDWGSASFKYWSSPEHELTADICTIWYSSPELLLGAKKYNPTALDIWSIGASLLHVWTSIKGEKFSLKGDTLLRIFELVGSPTSEAMKSMPKWKDDLPNFPIRKVSATHKFDDDQFADLIDKMLVTDPYDRITIDGIMSHPFMIGAVIAVPVISCRTRGDIMSRQSDLNEKMKQILIEWLLEVTIKLKCKMETLLLAVEIIDDMLLSTLFIRQKFQLLGITALLVAGKMLLENGYGLAVRDCIYVTDKRYTREQILACERAIMTRVPDLYTIMTRGPAQFATKLIPDSTAVGWITALLSIYNGRYSTDNLVETIVNIYVKAVNKGSAVPTAELIASDGPTPTPLCGETTLRAAHTLLQKLAADKPILGAIDIIFYGAS